MPVPPPPPTRSSPFGRLGLAGVVIVAAVVVAAAALAVVVLSSSTGAGGAPGITESSSTALASAQSLITAEPGGPWHELEVAGIDFTSGYSNDTPPSSQDNCSVSQFTGVSYPAFTGNYSNGLLSTWVVGFANAAGSSEVFVLVQGGTARVAEQVGGPNCNFGSVAAAALPSSLVSSAQAAQALLSTSNFSTFVRANPSANAEYFVFPFGALLGQNSGLAWTVVYTTCSILDPSTGPAEGSSVSGTVNASTGAVVATSYTPSESCAFPGTGSSPTPIGTAFSVGNPILSTCPTGDTFAANGCLAGDYTYTLTVESSSIEFEDVMFEVNTATEGIFLPSGPGGFAVVSVSGAVAAEYAIPSGDFMLMESPFSVYGSGVSPATPITATDTILLDMGPSDPAGTGLTLTALGTDAYAGSVSCALP